MPERAALVTGASSGIGLAIAVVLGETGHGLTVAARRPEKLAGAVDQQRGKGYEVEELAANLTAEEDVQRVVADIQTKRADITLSPACVIPEIVFQRPGEQI
jgi:NAD(P)-dependent dehydrogenase (short-subunit alcohol dehydrogenase family)